MVLFQVTYERDWHAYDLIGFALLGVCGVSTKGLIYRPIGIDATH
jgi:hypothetical protein